MKSGNLDIQAETEHTSMHYSSLQETWGAVVLILKEKDDMAIAYL